jgi:hypothetical protein
LSTSPPKRAARSDTRSVCSNAPAHVCAFKYVRPYCAHCACVLQKNAGLQRHEAKRKWTEILSQSRDDEDKSQKMRRSQKR